MGQHKGLLPVPHHNIPLLAFIVARVRTKISLARVVLVANEPVVARALPEAADVTVVADQILGQGPLRGLATGLSLATGWAIVLGCDMPFVNPEILRYLMACKGVSDRNVALTRPQAVIPVVQGKAQTLHALYHVSCLPAIEKALDRGERRMTSIWPSIRLHTVSGAELDHLDPRGDSFQNLNTPEDWEAARTKLMRLQSGL